MQIKNWRIELIIINNKVVTYTADTWTFIKTAADKQKNEKYSWGGPATQWMHKLSQISTDKNETIKNIWRRPIFIDVRRHF